MPHVSAQREGLPNHLHNVSNLLSTTRGPRSHPNLSSVKLLKTALVSLQQACLCTFWESTDKRRFFVGNVNVSSERSQLCRSTHTERESPTVAHLS